MSFLAKLEKACAHLIERTFARSFPTDVEPAQIARKLVATMEAQTRSDEGRLTAPGAYAVYVSTADFERLHERRDYLERAWTDLLRELAGRVGVSFQDTDASVTMAARSSLPLGAIAIEAVGEGRRRTYFALRMLKGVPPDGLYAIDGRLRVGRGDENDVSLADPSVSRAHAVVDAAGGTVVVRDLDSTNGTFVNGRRVQSESLRDGDEVRFGNTKMRFEAG